MSTKNRAFFLPIPQQPLYDDHQGDSRRTAAAIDKPRAHAAPRGTPMATRARTQMLDTIFKNGSERKQAQDDLRTLVEQAREERAQLAAMLQQVNGAAPTLTRTSRTLDDLRIKAEEVTRRSDKLGKVVGTYEECTKSFEQLEARMNGLLEKVAEARRNTDAMTAPDGSLQQMRQAADEEPLPCEFMNFTGTIEPVQHRPDTPVATIRVRGRSRRSCRSSPGCRNARSLVCRRTHSLQTPQGSTELVP